MIIVDLLYKLSNWCSFNSQNERKFADILSKRITFADENNKVLAQTKWVSINY